MSKFRNRIRDLGRAPAGFGFPALTRPQSTRHMLVVAEVEPGGIVTVAGTASSVVSLDAKETIRLFAKVPGIDTEP